MRVGGTNSRRSRATHRSRKPALNEHPLKSRPSGTDGHADRRNRHRRPRDRDPRRRRRRRGRDDRRGRRRRDPPRGVPRPRATRYRHRRPRAGRRPRALGAVARPRDRRRRRLLDWLFDAVLPMEAAMDAGATRAAAELGYPNASNRERRRSSTTSPSTTQRRRSRPRSRRGSAHDSERC